MTRWVPNESEIEPREVVARRLFGKEAPSESEVQHQRYCKLNDFFDSRLSDDLSVDRLGIDNPVKSVRERLTQVADDHAKLRQTKFIGWASVIAKNLREVVLRPDPIEAVGDNPGNPYHAVISRDLFRQKALAYHFAQSLHAAFVREGNYVAAVRSGAK